MYFYELFLVDQSRLINVPLRVLNFNRGGVERNRVDEIFNLLMDNNSMIFFCFVVVYGNLGD